MFVWATHDVGLAPAEAEKLRAKRLSGPVLQAETEADLEKSYDLARGSAKQLYAAKRLLFDPMAPGPSRICCFNFLSYLISLQSKSGRSMTSWPCLFLPAWNSEPTSPSRLFPRSASCFRVLVSRLTRIALTIFYRPACHRSTRSSQGRSRTRPAAMGAPT